MSFSRPSLSALIDRIASDIGLRLPGADSRMRRSALDGIVRAHAGATHGLYGNLDHIARSVLPETAIGAELDRRAATWGVIRKAASPAVGSVTLTGVEGAVIRRNVQMQRADGARYRTTATATIAAGSAIVAMESVDAGVALNAVTGTQLTLVSPVSGIQSVAIVAAPLAGGADEELDEALRGRLLSRIRTPPRGGAASDWVAWALEVAGVTRAWSYPNWMGPGTVGLTFVHDARADILPAPADLAIVAAHIEPLRPVCATPVIFAPEALPVNFLIRLNPDNGAIREAVAAELDDLFAREAQPGATLYLSRINEAISIAAGEFDHRLLAPGGNVAPGPGVLPVLGAIGWA